MRIISTVAFMWLIRVATLASSAAVGVITARTFGPVGRGHFALPSIDVSIAITFSVGLSSAASFFLLNRKAGPQIVRALSGGFVTFIAVGFILTGLMAVISHSTWAIAPALAYVTFYTAYSIVCGYYFGVNRARTAGIFNGMLSLVTLILIAIPIWLGYRAPSTAVTAWVTAVGLVSVVGVLLVLADARKLTGEDVDPLKVLRFGAKAGLLNVANLLNYRIDIFIVAMFLPVASVGFYTIAVTGAESALSLTLAIGQATLPRIGSLNRVQAGAFAARCLRNTLFFATILSSIAMLSSSIIVRSIFGSIYAPVVTPMRILMIGIIAASTTSILSNYFVLNMGRTMVPLTTSLLSSVVCGLVSVALIPRFGMIGAAIASTVAYVIGQSVAIALFCKVSEIRVVEALLVDRRDFMFFGNVVRRVLRWS